MNIDYEQVNIPADKPEPDFTWQQRRALIYEDMKAAGHWKALPYTTREYGNRFDVSHTSIQTDIQRLIEYEQSRIGSRADTELELVKGKAINDWLQAAEQARDEDEYETAAKCMSNAYNLISKHYRTLMEVGIIDDTTELEWQVSSEVVEVVNPDTQ